MARDLTPLILNRIHTRRGRSHYLLDIDVPVGETTGRLILHIGSAAIVANGNAYYHGLVDLGDVNLSRSKVPSDVTGGIENVSQLFTPVLSDPEMDFEGAEVVLSSAWRRDDGAYETDPLLIGTMQDVRFDNDRMTFRIESDASNSGFTIGADPIGPRCRHIFDGPGCNYSTQSTLPPAERIHIDCGKSHADCTDRGNAHRHPAAPALQARAVAVATGQLPGAPAVTLPNGWPEDGSLSGDPFGFTPSLGRHGL